MVGALRPNTPILSVPSFRTWLSSRPDEEHWELIEGVPMMMTPPNRRHQRIASNLETLLNAALKRHNPALAAYHDIGVNIVSTVPYDPEPDVAVIREDENPDPRYAERFYLVAEVLSESDRGIIESKRDVYRAHPSCARILLVRQDFFGNHAPPGSGIAELRAEIGLAGQHRNLDMPKLCGITLGKAPHMTGSPPYCDIFAWITSN